MSAAGVGVCKRRWVFPPGGRRRLGSGLAMSVRFPEPRAVPFLFRQSGMSIGFRAEALHAPVFLPFPVPGILPSVPVALDPRGRDAFAFPGVPVPAAVPVEVPPAGVDLPVESGHAPVVAPAAVVMAGLVPPPVPQPPPPADVEIDIVRDIGHGVDVGPRDDDEGRVSVIAGMWGLHRTDPDHASLKCEGGQDDECCQCFFHDVCGLGSGPAKRYRRTPAGPVSRRGPFIPEQQKVNRGRWWMRAGDAAAGTQASGRPEAD
ncbi:hypothetical protein DSECCO2_473610 [anaerobic digester metagenome]